MNNPVIRTFTGKLVNPLDLKVKDIDIKDIAHALALCNRFAGHTKNPISVAQHSVYVYRICARLVDPGTGMNILKEALLHDAAEAYLGDITKWLKQSDTMAGYRMAEERAEKVIYSAFGVSYKGAMHPFVKDADNIMVRFEGRSLHGHGPTFLDNHPGYPPLTSTEKSLIKRWRPWSWWKSESEFLQAFQMLWRPV